LTIIFGNDWRTNAQNQRLNRKSANNLQNNLGLRNQRNGDVQPPSNLEFNQFKTTVPNQRRGRQRHQGNRQGEFNFGNTSNDPII
jgi:hypothetical protein